MKNLLKWIKQMIIVIGVIAILAVIIVESNITQDNKMQIFGRYIFQKRP